MKIVNLSFPFTTLVHRADDSFDLRKVLILGAKKNRELWGQDGLHWSRFKSFSFFGLAQSKQQGCHLTVVSKKKFHLTVENDKIST